MNVLVTGGTGFVGREIVHGLVASGHAARVLSRGAPSQASEATATCAWVAGDVLDPASLEKACAGADAVIHLVGIISEVGEQTFENVHTRGTQNVVTAAERSGAKRFVHMSALGARPDAAARYHRSKWLAEEVVRRSGLAWTIFRPSIIYGPDDGFVNLFAGIIRHSPVVPIIGSGRTKFQPVPVESVASAFVHALSQPAAVGQTFDLCGAETFTLDGIVDQILSVMNRRRLKIHMPLRVARAQAIVLEFLFGKLLRRSPPLNRDQIFMLQEDSVGNPRAANELFALKPGSFGKGIARYLGKAISR